MFENIIAFTLDIFKISRKKACLINGVLMFVLSLPCALGFNLWSGFESFTDEANTGKGLKVKNWMRPYMQFVLPLMVLVILIYGLVTFNYG